MENINSRQKLISELVEKNNGLSSSEITYLTNKQSTRKVARITVVRDLDFLLAKKIIRKAGAGRGVKYYRANTNPLLAFANVEKYFADDIEERKVKYSKFNFAIFGQLKNLFSKEELVTLDKLNGKYRDRVAGMSAATLKKEFERLTIELAWKSSKLEGNTYTLIDTERLIKDKIPAKGKTAEETQMILNHKAAIDFVFENPKRFTKLNTAKIDNLHRIIVEHMDISKGFRKGLVGITGTDYKPLDNIYQINETMAKLVKIINKTAHPIEKALILNAMIAYIQPFEDGNKRTSRICGNAILNAFNYCPLSFRGIRETEYKKAVIMFYEQNNISYLKELLVEQFKFAVQHYFNV